MTTQEVMLPSNSNKIVKKVYVKKVFAKKKTSTKLPDTFFDMKVAAKKTTSRKTSSKTKVQKKLKIQESKKGIVVSVSALASRNLRRQWLFDLKRSSLVDLRAELYLQNKCKDKEGTLIGIDSLNCDKCFIPIHNMCVHEIGWVKGTSLFCFYSCMRNENPNVDDGNDGDVDIVTIKDSMCKFIFKYNENSYDRFRSTNSTIFQLIITFNPHYQCNQSIFVSHTYYSILKKNMKITLL